MEPQITVKKDYILVEPQESEFWQILHSFVTLFEKPEYKDKNVIWLFQEASIKIAYDELYKIKDFLKVHLPDNARSSKKVAVVVVTSLQAAMAVEYTKIVENLPREFKVFSNLQDAEAWITT